MKSQTLTNYFRGNSIVVSDSFSHDPWSQWLLTYLLWPLPRLFDLNHANITSTNMIVFHAHLWWRVSPSCFITDTDALCKECQWWLHIWQWSLIVSTQYEVRLTEIEQWRMNTGLKTELPIITGECSEWSAWGASCDSSKHWCDPLITWCWSPCSWSRCSFLNLKMCSLRWKLDPHRIPCGTDWRRLVWLSLLDWDHCFILIVWSLTCAGWTVCFGDDHVICALQLLLFCWDELERCTWCDSGCLIALFL